MSETPSWEEFGAQDDMKCDHVSGAQCLWGGLDGGRNIGTDAWTRLHRDLYHAKDHSSGISEFEVLVLLIRYCSVWHGECSPVPDSES